MPFAAPIAAASHGGGARCRLWPRPPGYRAVPGPRRNLAPIHVPPQHPGNAADFEAVAHRRRQVDAGAFAFGVLRRGPGAEDIMRIVVLERAHVLPLRVAGDAVGADGDPSIFQQRLFCSWRVPGDEGVDGLPAAVLFHVVIGKRDIERIFPRLEAAGLVAAAAVRVIDATEVFDPFRVPGALEIGDVIVVLRLGLPDPEYRRQRALP